MKRLDRNTQKIPVVGGLRTHNLKELFQGQSPEEWRAAYAGAFDWGPDVGREAVAE